jgi:hypothetical protein
MKNDCQFLKPKQQIDISFDGLWDTIVLHFKRFMVVGLVLNQGLVILPIGVLEIMLCIF